MISIARLLTSQSASPQLPKSTGWLELPNGQRVQPTPAQAYFASWSKKPYMPVMPRRSLWRRLIGVRG
ncbi:hypothetical protein PEC311524_10610 [Pectobacterium carotovorum subsp. carotovorum]|nr:hypothetical protein PEC311524_10610 [Pectobacterium carotovorum subsp. carotovorum]